LGNRKSPSPRGAAGAVLFLELNREGLALDDLAGLDAAGANAKALAGPSDDCFHRAQVHVPPTAGFVIRVGYIVSELRPLATKFTLGCH